MRRCSHPEPHQAAARARPQAAREPILAPSRRIAYLCHLAATHARGTVENASWRTREIRTNESGDLSSERTRPAFARTNPGGGLSLLSKSLAYAGVALTPTLSHAGARE